MFQAINQYINSCIQLSSEQLARFNQAFEHKVIPKKTILLQEGDVCKFEAFVVKGCVKTYYLDENGHEVILTFAIENWWVSDIASFHEQKVSRMFIETIEDSELLFLSYYEKEKILQEIPMLERAFRIMVQRHLRTYQERLYGNNALTADIRYQQFLVKYPNIQQRVPQHLIASYLGISPEFLSRIRTKYKK